MPLGAVIRKARKAKGWSQQELADRARISRRHLSAIERGDAAASLDVIGRTVRALGLEGIQLDGLDLRVSSTDRGFEQLTDELDLAHSHLSTARSILGTRSNVVRPSAWRDMKIADRPDAYEHVPTKLPFEVLDWSSAMVEHPLEAEVAAGHPLDYAVQGETVTIPRDQAPGPNEYLLRARGDSMIDFDIEDGDYVVVERRKSGVAATGEIVIAWLNDGITVKRWQRRGGKKILEAGNENFPSYELKDSDVFELQGIVRRTIKIRSMPKITASLKE